MDRFSQHVDFIVAMAVFENVDSPEAEILRCAQLVNTRLRETEDEDAETAAAGRAARASFDHWRKAFEDVRVAPDRAALKAWVRTYLCEKSEHAQPPHNVSQGMMKSALHLLWRRLYALEAGRGHPDPAEAIRDALLSPIERGQEYTRRLLGEIAAERGLTAEQLVDVISGSD